MRALSPVIINKDKESRASTQTCTGYKIHTDNARSDCQCDKYRFSLAWIIHRGHRQDILDLFKLPQPLKNKALMKGARPGQC